MYADDIVEADAISNDMYAAMCVHLWSRMEISFKRCIKAWNFDAKCNKDVDVHKFNAVNDFFSNRIGISLHSIVNYKFINALRILSNCYKHNNGRYKPGRHPIDLVLRNQWSIEKGHRISYLELPLKDILFSCGEFWEELLVQVRQKIEVRHYNF